MLLKCHSHLTFKPHKNIYLLYFQIMAEFSIFSPHEIHHRRDSSEENLDDSLDDDEGGTVPDSGVSEAGSQLSEDCVSSEVSTVSVTEEIRRFQKEINSVAVENSKFFKWKQERTPSKLRLSSEDISKEGKSKVDGKNTYFLMIFSLKNDF